MTVARYGQQSKEGYERSDLLEDREAGREAEVVSVPMMEGLKDLPAQSGKDFMVVYELVWAIGTGKPRFFL